MNKYNNIEEEIDAFLNHSMSQEEEQQFKTRILNSPELAEEVRLQKIVEESLRLLHREQTIERLRKNTTFHDIEPSPESPVGFQRFKYWIWGLLGLMACVVVYYGIIIGNPVPVPTIPNVIPSIEDSVVAQEKMVIGKPQDSLGQKSLDLKIKFPETGQNKIKLKNPSNYNSIKIGTSPLAASIVRIGQKIDPDFKNEVLEPRTEMSTRLGASQPVDVFKNSRKLILTGTTQSLKEALDTLNNMNKVMFRGEDLQEFYLLRGYTHFNLQQLDEAYADFDRPELDRSYERKSYANLYKWLCLRAYYEQYQSKADDLEKRINKRYKPAIAKYLDDPNGQK
jgi:hypothetical protein